ncbi:MAG: FkbM family methyltransferase [archaeon]
MDKNLPLLLRLGLRVISRLIVIFHGRRLESLLIRKGTTDEYTLVKIFLKREYNLKVPFKPRFIVDAGANNGYSSLFFAMKYPWAKIVSIEPEESNYQVLVKNTSRIKNIAPIRAGIWYKPGNLKLANKDMGRKKDSFQVIPAKSSERDKIPAITINQILKRFGKREIDILKIDIEGAEKELFAHNYTSWISKVNCIIIETHDHISKGCESSLFKAIEGIEFKKSKKGENIILIKNKHEK